MHAFAARVCYLLAAARAGRHFTDASVHAALACATCRWCRQTSGPSAGDAGSGPPGACSHPVLVLPDHTQGGANWGSWQGSEGGQCRRPGACGVSSGGSAAAEDRRAPAHSAPPAAASYLATANLTAFSLAPCLDHPWAHGTCRCVCHVLFHVCVVCVYRVLVHVCEVCVSCAR